MAASLKARLRYRLSSSILYLYRRYLRRWGVPSFAKGLALAYAKRQGASLVESHQFAKILGDRKKMSFIFPYYKKKSVIMDAINSLKNQHSFAVSPEDIEIIVIEDGSRDDLDDVLPDDVIYLRRNRFGYGISRCRNLGAKVANGNILCFVDPDLVFPNNYVDTLYRESQFYGEKVIISGYIDDYFYAGSEDPRVAYGVWERPNQPARRFYHLAGGHMAIHRSLFFDLGGFDEDLVYGEVEDTLFGYLCGQRDDTAIVFSTESRCRHQPHPVGDAHGKPKNSYYVAASKQPEFFKEFVLDNQR